MDHIRECNGHKIAEDDFARAWCARCLREDCTRSIKGKSRFEARVSTWQERLFTNVPRLDASDPRYADISAKLFIETPSRAQEVRGWDEPAPPQAELSPAPVIVAAPDPNPVVANPSINSQPARAPNQSGRILGTAPEGWAPKETIIRPGGRIRLSGVGVEDKDGRK